MLIPIKNLSTYDFQKVKSWLMNTQHRGRRKELTLRMQGDQAEAANCVSVWFRDQSTYFHIGDLANIKVTREVFNYLKKETRYTAKYIQIGKLSYASISFEGEI